jgi:hypothetical protein
MYRTLFDNIGSNVNNKYYRVYERNGLARTTCDIFESTKGTEKNHETT